MFAIYNTKLKSYAYLGYVHTDVSAIEPTTCTVLTFAKSTVIYVSTDKSELERVLKERTSKDDSYDDDTGEYAGDPSGSVDNPVVLFSTEQFEDCIIVEIVGTIPD